RVWARLVVPVLALTVTATATTTAKAADPALAALPPAELGPTENALEGEPPPAEEPAAPVASTPPLVITGYVDVGFAKAQGNGTSYPPGFVAPVAGAPVDYFVDTFAPAVNSRGEAASIDPGGQPVGGFFPRSAGIGGHPSFLL